MSHIVNYQWSFSLSQFDFAHSNIVILLNSKLSSHILYRQIKSLINLAEKTCENAVLYTKTIYNSLSWWPRTQQWSKYIRVQKYTRKTAPSVVVQFDGEKTIFGRDVSQNSNAMIKSEINYRIERPSNSGVQNLNRYAMDWWINSGSPYQHQAQNSKTWKKKKTRNMTLMHIFAEAALVHAS